jgi:hypothetical protein
MGVNQAVGPVWIPGNGELNPLPEAIAAATAPVSPP